MRAVRLRSAGPHLVAVLLLWVFFAQMVTSVVVESPTVDEQAHLMRGYVYLERGDLRFKIGHPILASALNAFPVWALTDLRLPIEDPSWTENRWSAFADRLFWRPDHDVDLLFFLGRLVTVALGMLFAAYVFRWARQLWGGWGGVVALALFVFDPTIVAHSRYTTDDVAVSFFWFVAAYGLWRYLETGRGRHVALTGVAFGLAQGSKFSALLLLPIFVAVVGLWPFLRPQAPTDRVRRLGKHALGLMSAFVLGGMVLWAGYRFEFGPLPGWRLPIPAPGYFEDLIWQRDYLGREGYVFLHGEYSATGWWYYFLVAFALKTPLPTLLLLAAAAVSPWRGTNRARRVTLLLPAMVYCGATLIVSHNIGYRFFIPVLPHLYVLAGRLAKPGHHHRWMRCWVLVGALAWNAGVAAWIHPHYLAYFNCLAGGPDNGWRYLVDSNLDWGQDLPTLREIVERHNLGRIKLSYFGTAHPSYYGLDFEPLPTWEPAPEQGNPFTRTYYPHHPAPGVYAISATLLQGVVMGPEGWDTYAWFRDRIPFAKAGYSIFLYRVEPTAPPVDVALSGLQIDELTPETFAAFGTNDVRLRWFDARTSFVVPAQPGWYVADTSLASWGLGETRACVTISGADCSLYPPDPEDHASATTRIERLVANSRAWHSSALVPSSDDQLSPLDLPVNLGDQLQFLGYELDTCNAQRAACQVTTAWRVTVPPPGPRAIFVHLLSPDGRIAAQWDGLDVPEQGWREGDTILQAASLDLSHLSPGRYWLQTGVYDPATMKRLTVLVDDVSTTDRILLRAVDA